MHKFVDPSRVLDIIRCNPDSIATKNLPFGYLLGVGVDPKTEKSNKKGKYLTAVLYLSPSKTMCPGASKGCLAACLNTAGNPAYLRGKLAARRARTTMLQRQPARFVARLCKELDAFVAKCKKLGVKPAVRLNGTSDVAWEDVAPWLFAKYATVTFYDYTKRAERFLNGGPLPANYHLTFSRNECNEPVALALLAAGWHVAVVVSTDVYKGMPAEWNGYKTEDGDQDDLIFLRDNPVQLLKAKGKGRKDESGFVVYQLA